MQSTHTATKSRKLTNCQLYDIVKENFFSSFYTTYIFIKYTIAFKNGKSISLNGMQGTKKEIKYGNNIL